VRPHAVYFFRYRDFGVFRQDTDEDGKAAVSASRLVLLAIQN
jgi:hypothetical protein